MFFIYFFLSLFSCFSCVRAKEEVLFNLVHGTWAKKSPWHKQQGGFFKTVKNWAKKNYTESKSVSVNSFEWSGKLSHESRIKAGKQLAYTIKQLPANTIIHIIAHSHGANVVFAASQFLAQEKSKHHIETCFLLGAPINVKHYAPHMEKISYVYNMFSFKDYVQTVFGTYSRTLPEHERIINLQITINGTQPGHSELISQTVAKWLPTLHKICQEKEDSFHAYHPSQPGLIHFFQEKKPIYALDIHQKKSLEYDKKIQQRMFDIYSDTYPQKKNNLYQKIESNFFEFILDQTSSFEHQLQELSKDI